MEIIALGYIGVTSGKLEDWSRLATGLLGMQQVDRAGNVRAFRMDDRKQRLFISDEGGDEHGLLGWEVASVFDLDGLAARLEQHRIPVRRGSRSLANQRQVTDLISFKDPGGNCLEAFYGPNVTNEPFTPGRPISGFKTGALGMGHVVLNVDDIDSLLPFYRDVLGFRITDFGLTPYKLYFFHINARHHSFAMVGSGRRSFHHFMLEVCSLDDVGQGYDLAQLEDGRTAYTLGRHTNDYITSFYAHTPSEFFVEYGWGGREIIPANWEPRETFDGPSFWGHDRLYMPDDQRARLRQMRLDAAARGVRAKINVNCAWFDSVIGRE